MQTLSLWGDLYKLEFMKRIDTVDYVSTSLQDAAVSQLLCKFAILRFYSFV